MTHRLTLTFPATAPGTARFAAADQVDDQADQAPAGAGTLTGPAVPLGVPSGPASDGARYRFTAPPANLGARVDVTVEHERDAVAGAATLALAGDQLVDGSARLFDTTRGRDLAVEVREGVRTGFSVGAVFETFTEASDGVRDVATWEADHLGVVRRPAFPDNAGLSMAASAQREDSMTTTDEKPGVQFAELPTIEELAEKVSAIIDRTKDSDTHPLAQFSSAKQFWAAFQAADEDKRTELAVQFAVGDQVTADNPGLIQPGWRREVKANLERRRPAIAASGGSIGLPDDGMTTQWPYFDGNLDALITKQAAEKAELAGVKIPIKASNPKNIETAGAASSVSYQLLMRSNPAYLAQHDAIMQAGWARFTEKQYEDALIAGGTDVGQLPALASAKILRDLLFDMSARVEDATGAPATYVLASTDVWKEAAGLDGVYNGKYGTQNAAGTSDAATLVVEVNGLRITRAPFLAADTLLASNDLAAKFVESGPMVATGEAVTKLARDVATWGMYVPAEVYFPAGVVYYDADV